METWKDIKGYEGRYQVSSKGKVKGLRINGKHCKRESEIVLKAFTCGSGYQEVILHLDGDRKPKLIHRLVAEAFIPNPHNKEEVNHKDGDKSNNNVDNLEWVTPNENHEHLRKVLMFQSFKRRIVCVETGEMFESIKSAADNYKLQSSLIWKCCNGRQRTTGGFHWEYV